MQEGRVLCGSLCMLCGRSLTCRWPALTLPAHTPLKHLQQPNGTGQIASADLEGAAEDASEASGEHMQSTRNGGLCGLRGALCVPACCKALTFACRMKSMSFSSQTAARLPYQAWRLTSRGGTVWRPARRAPNCAVNRSLHVQQHRSQAFSPGPQASSPQSGALNTTGHRVPTSRLSATRPMKRSQNHACLAHLGIHAGSFPAQARHRISHKDAEGDCAAHWRSPESDLGSLTWAGLWASGDTKSTTSV